MGSQKNPIFGEGVHKKPIYRVELPKRGEGGWGVGGERVGQFPNLSEGWQKKGRWCF